MKVSQAIRAYAAELIDRALRPLFGLPTLVSGLTCFASIAVLLQWGATEEALNMVVGNYAELIAFVTVCFLWFSVNSIACIWFARNRIAAEGFWVGNRFIFNSPQAIYSNQLATKNNSEVKTFNVKCAPPNSVVHMTLSTPNNSAHLQAIVQSPHLILPDWRNIITNRKWPTFQTGNFEISAQCCDQQKLLLDWYLEPDALPVVLSISAHAFEVHSDEAEGGLERYSLRVCQPTNDVDFTLQKPINQ